ncbi:MAG: hypothetical protein WBQ34_00910 [Candidatus Acidiferrales bacterium]
MASDVSALQGRAEVGKAEMDRVPYFRAYYHDDFPACAAQSA